MYKQIIGLTGSLGSGCTTIAEHLKDKGYRYISISSDILSPLAEKYDKPFSKGEEKQNFGNYVRENLREEYKNIFLNKVNEDNPEKVVIECFRNPIEIDYLRDEFPHFYLFALFAPKDPRKIRKNITEFDKLDKRDEGEENKLGQQVRRCVKNADIVIDNSSAWNTIDDANDFFKKVLDYIHLLEEPYRGPTEKEMLMHLAYSVSLHSKCIQRQVGAVISDENYRVLSIGYNDVPQESETCYDLFSECYRKIKKRKNLNLQGVKICPYCGSALKSQGELLNENPILRCDNDKCGKSVFDMFSAQEEFKELEYCRSLHAEENAILSNPFLAENFYTKNKKLIIFTTTFPCMLCSKKIANSGIKHLFFVEPYPMPEAYEILQENDVTIEPFEGVKSLKFNWIFRKRGKYLKDSAFKRRKELDKLKGG